MLGGPVHAISTAQSFDDYRERRGGCCVVRVVLRGKPVPARVLSPPHSIHPPVQSYTPAIEFSPQNHRYISHRSVLFFLDCSILFWGRGLSSTPYCVILVPTYVVNRVAMTTTMLPHISAHSMYKNSRYPSYSHSF